VKIILGSRRHHYVARVSIFLITVALIVGMVGCDTTARQPTPQYDLTIASTAGGSVTTPGEGTLTYDEGTVVDLVAVADECYEFVNWTDDAVADPNSATTTITVNDNYSITANFGEGNVAPDFTLPTMTGADITLSELIGTPVVVNFWSISCYWCRKQLPYLENVAQQSEGKIKVIVINIGESASRVQTFFGDYEPTMIVALDKNRDTFSDYSLEYNNPRGAIPFTFFIDSEGIVKDVTLGAFQSETRLWDALHSVFEL
jgi:peroxiredoxin